MIRKDIFKREFYYIFLMLGNTKVFDEFFFFLKNKHCSLDDFYYVNKEKKIFL